ncbi:MAG: L-threonylcarbamoyladenylate synthase [Candidatus Aenigmatarchaeota archaeon]
MSFKEPDTRKARKTIEKGGLVVYPTETAYGIAADALNKEAVENVYEAKNRPRNKGLTVIVKNIEQADRYANISEDERKIVESFMPGPLTLIVEKKENVPDNLNDKFVFRISSSKIARKLAENGPITATSANISGEDTSYSVEDISEDLLDKVDYVLDAGLLEEGPTSTIVEIIDSEVTVHREGPIKKKEIEKVLQG